MNPSAPQLSFQGLREHGPLRWMGPAAMALTAALVCSPTGSRASTPEGLEFFEKKIRPVLVAECIDCHNAEKTKGGLRLDFREGWRKGGDSGPAIVPGNPKGSLLMRSIRHEEPDLKMPSKAPKLDAAVLADFEQWIAGGAPDPREEPSAAAASQGDLTASKWEQALAMRRQWWSLQPVRPIEPPPSDPGSPHPHPVDRFLHAKQAEHGLHPAPAAPAAVVLRRLSFVLTGLPPEPEQLTLFEKDYTQDPGRAVASAVDSLLQSERFGEHWANHWMDLVRYCESHGSETDQPLPLAWRYRDYLVRLFNQDLPLDAAIREHLAGDLFPNPRKSSDGLIESTLGPAHFRMVEHGENALDTREDQVRVLDNQIDVITKAFQGLTVACARCHDHKFDAISQRDYYALQGILAAPHLGQRVVDAPEHLNRHNEALSKTLEDLRQGLATHWRDAARALPDELPDPLHTSFDQEDAWKQLFQDARRDSNHPLRPWIDLPESHVPEAWNSLRTSLSKQLADHKASNSIKFQKVWDFRDGNAPGWLRSGAGLDQRPEAGRFHVFPAGDRILECLHPPALLSHTFSSRQHGILISPEFTIETGRISVRAFGSGGMIRLLPDNYAVARRFHAKAFFEKDEDRWLMLTDRELPDPERRNGHRARLEVVTREDSSIPLGSAKKRSTESFFGISEIVFHKQPTKDAPAPENSPLELLLEKPAPASRSALGKLYAEVIREAIEAWAAHQATENQIAFLNPFLRAGVLPVHLSDLPALRPIVERYRHLHSEVPEPRRAPGLYEMDSSDAPLLARGDHKSPGPMVPRGYLQVFDSKPWNLSPAQSGRLELAEAIVSPHNPLTARVMANRIWHWVFGVGIVPTVDNFGRMGEPPSHPELLDYLAGHLVREGWSLKNTLRFLLTTETFRSSSKPSEAALEIDPANRWLSHMRIRRLDAESIRDNLLKTASLLTPQPGGPGTPPNADHTSTSRSLYLSVRRSLPSPFLGVFDKPQPFTTFGRRDLTTVPAQSLTLLNGPLASRCASMWAQKLLAKPGPAPERLEQMFLSAFARKPSAHESEQLLATLQSLQTDLAETEANAWTHLAHTLLNTKEFIHLP
jgi:hypothetical protein